MNVEEHVDNWRNALGSPRKATTEIEHGEKHECSIHVVANVLTNVILSLQGK
jgi:hypothetical protein